MRTSAARSGSFRSLLVTAAVVVVIALAVAGIQSYRDLQAIRARERMLLERIEQSKANSVALEQQIEWVRSDPTTLERLAREDLGLVRPGDVVILLPDAAETKETKDTSN